GLSTVRPLAVRAEELARRGALLHFTDIKKALGPIEAEICEQEGGSHADETETSMLLYIDPASVVMSKARKDYDLGGKGGLSPRPGGQKTYSPTGIWGDAALAARGEGEKIIAAMSAGGIAGIEALR